MRSSACDDVNETKNNTHPRDVVDMGLKSVRPDSTKWCRTSAQSSRESQVILLGESTSTGMTWLTSPHCMMMTAVPMPPLLRQRSSRRRMSSPTRGSLSVTYVRGTTCVDLTENLWLIVSTAISELSSMCDNLPTKRLCRWTEA